MNDGTFFLSVGKFVEFEQHPQYFWLASECVVAEEAMRDVLALQHSALIMRIGHLHLLSLTFTSTFSRSSRTESEDGRPVPLEKSFLEKLWMLSLSCWLALR